MVVGGTQINSIQGFGRNEVYLAVPFEEIANKYANKSTFSRAGLTGVTRARNFVAMVGPVAQNTTNENDVTFFDSVADGDSQEDIDKRKLEKQKQIDAEKARLKSVIDPSRKSTQKKPQEPEKKADAGKKESGKGKGATTTKIRLS